MTPNVFKSKSFLDYRGKLSYFNEMNLSGIKRMYVIEPSSIDIIRAWQGHRYEHKWFCVVNGIFEVKLVVPDNWGNPSKDLEVLSFTLDATNHETLHIPGGYYNGFRAKNADSRMLVFSNFELEDSRDDDYRLDERYWNCW